MVDILSKVHFNWLLSSHLLLGHPSLYTTDLFTKSVRISGIFHMCHMPHPSQPSRLRYPIIMFGEEHNATSYHHHIISSYIIIISYRRHHIVIYPRCAEPEARNSAVDWHWNEQTNILLRYTGTEFC